MAQKILVEMLDDIDGTPATQTVPFALDGVAYEIDLSDDNAAALRTELERYVEASRRVGGRRVKLAVGQSASETTPQAAVSRGDRERNQEVRWSPTCPVCTPPLDRKSGVQCWQELISAALRRFPHPLIPVGVTDLASRRPTRAGWASGDHKSSARARCPQMTGPIRGLDWTPCPVPGTT